MYRLQFSCWNDVPPASHLNRCHDLLRLHSVFLGACSIAINTRGRSRHFFLWHGLVMSWRTKHIYRILILGHTDHINTQVTTCNIWFSSPAASICRSLLKTHDTVYVFAVKEIMTTSRAQTNYTHLDVKQYQTQSQALRKNFAKEKVNHTWQSSIRHHVMWVLYIMTHRWLLPLLLKQNFTLR